MPDMPTSMRLDDETRYLADAIRARTGLKFGAVLRIAVRRYADSEGIARPTPEQLAEWQQRRPRRAKKQHDTGE